MRPGRLVDRLGGLRGSSAAITVPMLLAVSLFIALAAAEGGYFPLVWLPAALLALGLLVTSLLTVSTRAAVPRTVLASVSLLAAYAAWSYVSILWADDPGVAFDAGNRTLMYAVVFALFALWPMRGGPATGVIGALGLGVAGLGLVTLLRAGAAADASELFLNGRLAAPVGYTNGDAALWFIGALACVFLAGRREVLAPLRGLSLGGAGLLAGLALMTQSRGWLFTAPLALVLLVVLAPGRARNGLAGAAVVGAVVIVREPLLAVVQDFRDEPLEPLVDAASRSILLMAGALAALGLLAAILDRGVRVSARAARVASAATVAVLALVAVGAATAGLAAVGDPVTEASEAWEEFKAGSTGLPQGETRFASLATNRYDFWQVAADQFARDPLVGAGADNFQDDYLAEGKSTQQPRFPHSLELRVLGQTGLVGSLLFGGGMTLALLMGLRAALARSGLAAGAAGAALAIFLYWAIHGSVDWFFEIPALAGPAFALLGLACALAPRRTLTVPRREGSDALVGGRLGTPLLVLAALTAAVALTLPWVAQLETRRATEVWPEQPGEAFARLRRAASLNPLSVQPHTTAAAIALRLDELELAQRELAAAEALHPRSAYSVVQLGALASELGDRREAAQLLERAGRLAPREPVVADTLEAFRSGRKLDAEATYDALLARRRALTDE